MTQAYNLSQLANNLNTSGQLDATDGLVNAVPVANGGTGSSTQAGARTNLDVPSTAGSGASGTWSINVSGSAGSATSATTVTTTVASGATGTTQSNGDNSTKIATTAYVQNMSLGWGQTASANLYSSSRVYGTTYTNSTGKPIYVYISTSNASGITFVLNINGTAQTLGSTGTTSDYWISFIVPSGNTYSVSVSGGTPTFNYWYELK